MDFSIPDGLVIPDSNIWIDWLVGTKSSAVFDPLFERGRLLVPSIVMFEVTRWFLARASEENSQQVGLYLSSSQRCVVDDIIAVEAAQLAKRHRLAMADAMILACAHVHNSELWTQDADFAALPGVRLFPKL